MLRRRHRQIRGELGRRVLGQGPFRDPVFKRVIALHHDPAAHSERVNGRGQGPLEHTQLVIDFDPQRLEGAFGRMSSGALRSRWQRAPE